MKKLKLISRAFAILMLVGTATFFSCEKDHYFDDPELPLIQNDFEKSSGFILEDFESGSKTSYAGASVTLSSGSWYFYDALLGTLSTDRKIGTKSVRMVNTGKITMQFDATNGASTVEVYHAVYGSDGSSSWELYMSTNGGSTWTKVGSTITTSSTTLTKETFTIGQSGSVRFEIRKISGGSSRINFDDFRIVDYSVPSPIEDFEMGSKTSYTGASINLATGQWYFYDALIGTSSYDRKFDLKSARIINTGKLTMQFDRTNGAGTVELYHAKYGNDKNSSWELYMSTNSGGTWVKVGSTVTTSSKTLTKATFTVNQAGNVRFEIRKISGGKARINIDNINITDYTTTPPIGTPTRDDNLAMGNPSGAIFSTAYPSNYLMVKDQYVMSYNDSKKTSNWVSWHLSSAWLGSTPRQDDFRADPSLPTEWIAVGGTDYSGSGFDRGHMCPSADRTGSVTDNSATFLMTNMIPQAPRNNQITWSALETYCRNLISEGNELYIISGPWGQGGTGSYGYATTISSKDITVPSYVWKVIVVLPVGDNDVQRVNTSTRVIAVWMPNNQTVDSQHWSYYRTTVDYIESQTGYNFMSNVSTTIQSELESKVDNGPTS